MNSIFSLTILHKTIPNKNIKDHLIDIYNNLDPYEETLKWGKTLWVVLFAIHFSEAPYNRQPESNFWSLAGLLLVLDFANKYLTKKL
tara:strand:+ start:297 stop:557 length:261 start_codon:yes stop_codon:yes gene_type:complete